MSTDKQSADNASLSSSPDDLRGESVLPGSPTRPGRNVSARGHRSRGSLALPILVVAILGAVGYGAFWTNASEQGLDAAPPSAREVLAATRRAVSSAQAAVETRIREPALARKGARHKSGLRFAEEIEREAKQRARHRKTLAARGLTPPLTSKEVDKALQRRRKSLQHCYLKHFPNVGNFHRVMVGARIDPHGRVLEVALTEKDASKTLRNCVAKAVRRLRFRGRRESTETHEMYVVLGKVRPVKK